MKELSLMPHRDDSGKFASAIDALYQAPLSAFTSDRNELAKTAGPEAAAIRALPKPGVPAWAVNQLYWRDRRVYDALTRASDRLRAAHARALNGKKVDLPVLELQHSAAVKEAAESVRGILARAGDPATPATMKAVVDTLQALPGGGTPGRLSRPLAPLSFGALGALMKGAATPRTLAEVVAFAPPKPKADEREAAQRLAEQEAARRLRAIEAQSTRLSRDLVTARAALQRVERVHAALDGKLQAALAAVATRRSEVARLDREARALAAERATLRKPGGPTS